MANRQSKTRLAVKIIGWLIAASVIAAPIPYVLLREPVVEVTAVEIAPGPVEKTVAAIATGTVMPAAKSMVAAALMGVIDQVHVKEGSRVQEGDLLVELDHEELDAQVSLTEANLKVGKSRVEQARIGAQIAKEISAARLSQAAAQLELAEADFARIKALSEKNAVSNSDFDKAVLALRVARETKAAADAGQRENLVRAEELKSAEAALEQLGAGIEVARATRERAFVRAPFSGVVAKVILDAGEAVAMGLPLLHLVRTEDCYIAAPFDEAVADEIALGQPVRIELDAYPDDSFKGEVIYVAPVISMNRDLSRTLDLKVRIDEGHERMLPGMSVDVTIVAEKKDSVLTVPTESLIRDEFVYVIEDGRAVARNVELGIGNWEAREVLSGLQVGDKVITSVAMKALKDNTKVTVVDELEDY